MSGDEPTRAGEELETSAELVCIVAVAENGVIGSEGDIPWHLPADLKHFKETTMDHPVIMGRITYEGILERLGEPLPGRTTIVVTHDKLETPENVIVANGLEEALERAEIAARDRHGGTDRVFVAGGETIYEQLFPAIERLIVTEVYDSPDGDSFFPEWNREQWREVSRDDREGFAFCEYVRSSAEL